MSQSFTDDWYAQSANANTAFGQAENNDLALKSCFSGGSAPSNAVAGMLWYDTANGILKIRNTGNTAWVSIYDADNDRAYNLYRQVIAGTGLSGGGYLTEDRTLAIATGGVDTDQLAAAAVTLDKITDQIIKIGTYNAVAGISATTSNSYAEILTYAFICPEAPSYIAGEIRHKGGGSTTESEARLRVELASDGSTVATGVKVSQTGTAAWDEFPSLDISGLTPGTKYRLIMEMQNETEGVDCYLYAASFWFKN